jgi:asparagine synthetase B (glutamine-hydrolysing)
MTDAIAHRGPDGEGHWIEDNVAIGHRWLGIIDLSPTSHHCHNWKFVDEQEILSGL